MRLSRFWVLTLISITVLTGANCGYYNQVMARKNLVDGSKAYKDRKFPEAESLFRYAASLDPDGNSVEGRTAQLSLARTIHSTYIGNRQKTEIAESALIEYNKSLPQSLKELKDVVAAYDKDKTSQDAQRKYLSALSAVNSTTSAISSLYENLAQPEKTKQWQTKVAGDAEFPPTARARALSSLAAKQNSCSNDITDTEATKKTIKKDGKDVFQFIKPANPADFAQLGQCVAEGKKLIDQAVALEPEEVKNAATFTITSLSDSQLPLFSEIFKVFESTRSYRSALLVQEMRSAEMDGRTPDRDRLRTEADAAKAKFAELSDVVKKITAEIDKRIAEKIEAEKPESLKSANSNSAANK